MRNTFIKPQTVTGRVKDTVQSFFGKKQYPSSMNSLPQTRQKSINAIKDQLTAPSRAQLIQYVYLLQRELQKKKAQFKQIEQNYRKKDSIYLQMHNEKLIFQKKYNQDLHKVKLLQGQNNILKQQINHVNKIFLELKLENEHLKLELQNKANLKISYEIDDDKVEAMMQEKNRQIHRIQLLNQQIQQELVIQKQKIQKLLQTIKIKLNEENQNKIYIQTLNEKVASTQKQLNELLNIKKETENKVSQKNQRLEQVENLATMWELQYIQYLKV